jgi:O-antigen ligase
VLGIAALLSVAIAVALPGLGVQGGKFAGLWRGAFIFKNILGRTMNLSAEIFLLLALSSKRYSRILWAGFGLSVFLILRSGSTTALAVLLLVSSLLPLYKFLQQRQYKLQVVVITFSIFLVGSVAALIVVNAATLVGATGKDLTFSGRTELWPVLVEFIGQRFWLGYGYEAFWPSHGFFISNMQNWEITHAHNGYLDLSLSLGLIGVSLYALSFVSAFLRAVTQMFTAQKAEHFWPLQLLVMLLVFELTIETTILSSTSIWWIAYVSTALSLAVQQRRISRARLASENSLVNF